MYSIRQQLTSSYYLPNNIDKKGAITIFYLPFIKKLLFISLFAEYILLMRIIIPYFCKVGTMLILGIESSCDETSIAILNDSTILSNKIYTQQEHTQFGGVVPEIASREHIKKIDRLTHSALKEANISITDIDLIAITDRPGLAGALLVGISYAYGLHLGYNIPITGVNHLEGHIAAVTIEHEIPFPFIALVVSGGHTSIYKAEDFGDFEILGQTIDDAAGEAFDKIGKLMGFNYPAGRDIENEAKLYTGDDPIAFPVAQVNKYTGHNFSFSGLKTAVKYYIESIPAEDLLAERPRICYSFQKAVIKALIKNLKKVKKDTQILDIAMVGGVASNRTIRQALTSVFGAQHTFFPSPVLCTDNAAMIAKAGYENNKRGLTRLPKMQPTSDISRTQVRKK